MTDLAIIATTIVALGIGTLTLEISAASALGAGGARDGSAATVGWATACSAGSVTGGMGCTTGWGLSTELFVVAADLPGVTAEAIAGSFGAVALVRVGVAAAHCSAVTAAEGEPATIDGAATVGRNVEAILGRATGVLEANVAVTATETVALAVRAFT